MSEAYDSSSLSNVKDSTICFSTLS